MYYCEVNVAKSPPDGESTEVPTSSLCVTHEL